MKLIITLMTLFLSFPAMSHLEHRDGQESKPSTERLSVARGCFDEIQDYGCSHPREGQEIFNTCLDQKIEMISLPCQAFFTRLYGNRSHQ
jgi:hypothetical protein